MDNKNSYLYIRIIVALFAIQIILIVYFVYELRFLYGDGSNFFRGILEHQAFYYGGRKITRQYANIFTQLPLLIALKAGIQNLQLLKYIYGASLFFPYILCIAVWLWAARKNPEFLLFLALLLFSSAANSLFFIISESHLAGALFFALLPLLLFHRPWGFGTIVLSAILALPLLRAYESMVFFGPLLAALALHRALESLAKPAKLAWILLCGWFLAGAFLSFLEIVAPAASPGITAASFADDAVILLQDQMLPILSGDLDVHHGAILSLLALAILCLGFWDASTASRIKVAVIWAFAILCLTTLAVLASFPELLQINHYRARTLNAILPFVLGLAIVFFRFTHAVRSSFDWRYALVVVAILGAYQLAWHGLATRQWAGYLDVFRNEVSSKQGYIPFEDSSLNAKRIGRQAIGNLNYGWAMPTMSLMLSPSGKVQAIVGPRWVGKWQPFDPLRPEDLPDLSRYGISYDRYLEHLKR